jgi:outer membrane usher protein
MGPKIFRSGEAIVPNIVSNNNGKISIDLDDIPFNYRVSTLDARFTQPYRSGNVIDFEVKRIKAVTGKVFIVRGGKKNPAEYAGLRVMVEGEPVETIVGKRGEIYLEDILPGTYSAAVHDREGECFFEITIKDSKEIIGGTVHRHR